MTEVDLSALYGWNVTFDPTPFSSFKISRPLERREQLDFSLMSESDDCGHFLMSYWYSDWPRDSLCKTDVRRNPPKANTEQLDVLI